MSATGTIDFGQYLTQSERHEIAVDEFRKAVRSALATKNDVERFIGNVAWVAVGDLVDEGLADLGDSAREVIAQKLGTVIRNLAPYNVFREGDQMISPRPSLAQKYLEAAVRDNQDLIAKRVRRIIGDVGAEDVRNAITDVVRDAFANLEPKP